MNCVHLGWLIDAGDSGIKSIRNACDRYEARRCTEAQTSRWKGDIATRTVIYHAIEMKGPWPMTERWIGQHGDGTFGDIFIGQ